MKYNPFNPNSVVSPSLFAGRSDQVIGVYKKLSSIKHKMPASFFVYGERGIGKTALVKLVKYLAENKANDFDEVSMLTSYYLVEEKQELSSVMEESINNLTKQMSVGVMEALAKSFGDLFKNGKFNIGAYGASVGIELDNASVKKGTTIKDQSVSILSSIIDALSKEEENKKDGILIIIDEIHNLKDKKSIASVLRNIITTLDVDGVGAISFLLIGYKEDMEDFFNGDPSAHRAFDGISLETMPNQEAMEVLRKGFKEISYTYDEEALKRNISVAGGYPHSLQVLGYNLVEIDNNSNIEENDWEEAILKTSEDLKTKEFAHMYSFDKKSGVKDKILQILAKENKPLSKKYIANIIPNPYQYFGELKKTGAIKDDENANIYLQSQLFRTAILIDDYLRRFKESKEGKGDVS